MHKHISDTSKRKIEGVVFDIRDKMQDSGLTIDKRQLVAIVALLAVVIVGSVVFYVNSKPKPVVIAAAGESKPKALPESAKEAAVKEAVTLYVHVAGAVSNPGVFQLKDGSRVIDAVKAAGGEAEGADIDALNLAAKLVDGQRIYVPKKGEAALQPVGEAPGIADPAVAAGAKVNLNLATAEQLDALSGVGEVTVRKIIEYRTEHGPFKRVEDIMQIDGIGKKKFENLKDEITVE